VTVQKHQLVLAGWFNDGIVNEALKYWIIEGIYFMRDNRSNGWSGSSARACVFFWAALILSSGLIAPAAEAAPFAYVANSGYPATVSVIDTVTNIVVATVPVGAQSGPLAVTQDGRRLYVGINGAGTVLVIDTVTNTLITTIPVWFGSYFSCITFSPDGRRAYVTNSTHSNISVIDTATNQVAGAPIIAGAYPQAVAVTPDGTHLYAANIFSGTVSVIDVTSNSVVGAPIYVGNSPVAVTITPDGKFIYVTNQDDNNVSVIAAASNRVVATIPVGYGPEGTAITPDGKFIYVTNHGDNNVSVIAAASNQVVATVPVGQVPTSVAIGPDGKHAYVSNFIDNDISVIDTASNTVVGDPIQVGNEPGGVAIVPPPPGEPFLGFYPYLAIKFGSAPNSDAFTMYFYFALRSAISADFVNEAVVLRIGTFVTVIPPGAFRKQNDGSFLFAGALQGVNLWALIKPAGGLLYTLQVGASGANLAGASNFGISNFVYVTLTTGYDSGAASVWAYISP